MSCLFAIPHVAAAQITRASIDGTVVDAGDGIPLAGAQVDLVGRPDRTSSDARGHFHFVGLMPGEYRLSVRDEGYQPVVSEPIDVRGSNVAPTLALARSTAELRTIAVTAARPAQSLLESSTFARTLTTEELRRQGITRAADALRQLPGVNNGITGDTAAPGDDINLSLRGIGTLETVAAIDGHPIGYGIKGGYNFQVSPIVPFRNVQVLYGSGGSDFLGVNAIGGVVHFETLDPTPEAQFSYDQGYGTFGRLASSATATGTAGHLGYALAYGASGLDGPLSHTLLYQPNAAFDQSATLPAVRNLAVYPDDSSAISRSSLVKLRYGDDAHNSVTFTSVISSYWVDKTGNGDGDYLDYTPALAFGEQLLAHKTSSDPCAAGTFTATNANGVPNGAGPGGIADGGVACQTPAQYASFNQGWQGSGTSWQTFALNDEDLAFRHAGAHSRASVDAFTTRYDNNIDRRFNLPFVALPGDKGSSKSSQVTSNGVLAQNDFLGERNDVGVGFSYLNNAYLQRAVNAKGKVTSGSPVDTETAFFVRDAYHPEHSNLSGFLTVWAKRASETQTSYIDPRIALVYHTTPRDIVRASFGATTTQPSSDMIGEPFIQAPPGGAGGGASITCGGLNSIGSAPSSLLKPERGVDQELAYAHRWTRDTQVQVSLYNVNVFDKLYSTIVPLSQTGTAFIDPAYLASVNAQIAGKCGAAVAPSLLGVSGNFNVGTLRARGLDIAGRYRIDPRLFFDYDWSLTSTILLGANPLLLQKTLTLIPGDQVPRLPLHTFSGSFDATMRDGLNVRYTLHAVSVNNTKALPAYDYSDLRLLYPLRRGTFSVTVSNLFNQWADIRGLRYEGVPLPLNGYATGASYAPYTGASATEQFGLPYRTIYFNYELRG